MKIEQVLVGTLTSDRHHAGDADHLFLEIEEFGRVMLEFSDASRPAPSVLSSYEGERCEVHGTFYRKRFAVSSIVRKP